MIFGGRKVKKACQVGSLGFGCGLEGHLARLGSHVVVNGAAERQHHPILGPSWPYLGASWGQGGAKMGFLGCILGRVAAFWGPPGGSWEAS